MMVHFVLAEPVDCWVTEPCYETKSFRSPWILVNFSYIIKTRRFGAASDPRLTDITDKKTG